MNNEDTTQNDETPSPKSAEEVEELRDRIGTIVSSGKLESGSRQWHKLEAAEAALDWTLGELEGFPRVVSTAEADMRVRVDVDGPDEGQEEE